MLTSSGQKGSVCKDVELKIYIISKGEGIEKDKLQGLSVILKIEFNKDRKNASKSRHSYLPSLTYF